MMEFAKDSNETESVYMLLVVHRLYRKLCACVVGIDDMINGLRRLDSRSAKTTTYRNSVTG